MRVVSEHLTCQHGMVTRLLENIHGGLWDDVIVEEDEEDDNHEWSTSRCYLCILSSLDKQFAYELLMNLWVKQLYN